MDDDQVAFGSLDGSGSLAEEAGKQMGATPEEIKALVRRREDAMNSRDLDLLDDVVAEDFVRHCEATPDVEVNSREEFKEFLRQNTTAFSDNLQTFHQVIVEGDLAGIWVED